MECDHDEPPAHHLIYKAKLKKDGKKKVLCSWCDEPIWGSLYNCIECGNRPVHKYSSVQHCLDFTKKLESGGNKEVICSGCDEPLLGPAYKCSVSECSFVIHKPCTEIPRKISHPLHPYHPLSLQEIGRNRCDACCRSHNESLFYSCLSCHFQLDIKCANRLPIKPNDCHQHEFFSIFREIQLTCDTCGSEIKNIVYRVCSICKLLVHNRCAELPPTIKIKLHNHFLNLIYSPHEIKKPEDMFCGICYENVDTKYAAYHCKKCRYVCHLECVTHFTEANVESTPNQSVGHATHLIKALNQADDDGPHLGMIEHFCHQQHKLILCNDEVKDDKVCQGCMELIISVSFYSCAQCNIFLHTRCAELPKRIEQHQLDDFHTLTLLPQAPTKSGVFFCYICSRHHRGFVYKCEIDGCGKFLDVQCGSIPKTLKHEGHQHCLFLALDSNRKCNACSKDKENSVFVCTSCNFALGVRCANLPLLARHNYDTHLLKLTYVAEDDFGEYCCLICEGERDSNHWFYYCAECNFPAHVECVLGNYPCIMIGSTYKSEYHQHPLTFVQTTEDLLRCDVCFDDFDGVALECSQCNFSVHPPRPYFPDCLLELLDGDDRLYARYSEVILSDIE